MNIDINIDGGDLLRFLSHDQLLRTAARLAEIEVAANNGEWQALAEHSHPEHEEAS